MKLLLRRRARRKLRRLRRKVSKRSSARIRKAVLVAATHPVRRHLYYKRLLLTRRLGASIHRLRGLRPSAPQSAIEKNNAYSTLIVRG